MSLEAPPPSRPISSHPVSLSTASSILETYLRNSEAHAHLHPDALITPTGVTFSSHGGPTGGVVMHNLRRVAAGLRGEYLEPEPTPEPEEKEEDGAGGDVAKTWRKGKSTHKKFADEGPEEEGWTDMATYAQEEGLGIEIGEIGERTNVVAEGGEEPEIQATDASGKKRKDAGAGGDAGLDKAARKKAKKERDLQRKRENAKKSEKKDD